MEIASNSKKNPYKILTIVLVVSGILMLVLASWGWWKYKYLDEETVFWKTIERSLSLNSVTHEITQDSGSQKVKQEIQLNFNEDIHSSTLLTLEEPSEQGTVSIQTKSIGTQNGSDYIQYTNLEVPGTDSYDKAENVWAKIDSERSSFLANSLSSNLVLFANLGYNDRNQIMSMIRDANNPVYLPDFVSVTKEKRDGRLVYSYIVLVDSDAYAQLLISYLDTIGQKEFADQLRTQPVEAGQSVEVVMDIDAVSRHLLSVRDAGAIDPTTTDSYYLHDVPRRLEEPTQTVTYEELQELLRSVE